MLLNFKDIILQSSWIIPRIYSNSLFIYYLAASVLTEIRSFLFFCPLRTRLRILILALLSLSSIALKILRFQNNLLQICTDQIGLNQSVFQKYLSAFFSFSIIQISVLMQKLLKSRLSSKFFFLIVFVFTQNLRGQCGMAVNQRLSMESLGMACGNIFHITSYFFIHSSNFKIVSVNRFYSSVDLLELHENQSVES